MFVYVTHNTDGWSTLVHTVEQTHRPQPQPNTHTNLKLAIDSIPGKSLNICFLDAYTKYKPQGLLVPVLSILNVDNTKEPIF